MKTLMNTTLSLIALSGVLLGCGQPKSEPAAPEQKSTTVEQPKPNREAEKAQAAPAEQDQAAEKQKHRAM